ncbi:MULTISPECIES: TetR/AcrR family transcriptional regulator [unclassified Sphingomonas]|uniref:TetR/AcrR family transcriptional regulator n=1 Tax=unclassified Sphingomonas TaxID=196159 RepID=UPI00269F94F4
MKTSSISSRARPQPVLGQATDGRHLRSRTTRAKIVEALLTLVRDGEVAPGAAQVAEMAGVGLRTVFRHFDEMESLYREMAEVIEAQVMPIMLKPFEARLWRDRVREMADRRIGIYETIMPYRISSSIKRFQSDFLMQGYHKQLQLERTSLHAILPEAVIADAPAASAIEVTISFQCWRRLRHDQGLVIEDARAVIHRLLEAVLASITD